MVQQQQQQQQQQQPVVATAKEEEKSGCPMHNADGSYSFNPMAMLRSPHGPTGRKPLDKMQVEQAIHAKSLESNKKNIKSESACPIKHSQNGGGSGSGSDDDQAVAVEYNVYAQPLHKDNNTPTGVANQLPAPTQTQALSTERVSSTIPKGGGSNTSTWTYPSPQQFYNALARKNKLGDTTEADMEAVVAIHNHMNETTWDKVLEWERVLSDDDNNSSSPKLLKFMGRPKDLSPKAALKHYILGHPLPFDRHDWTVLRPDGTTIRYVIDYYYDTHAKAPDQLPTIHDRSTPTQMMVDVRPALDSSHAFLGRTLYMPAAQASNKTKFATLSLFPTNQMKQQVQESIQVWKNIQNNTKEPVTEQDLTPDQANDVLKEFKQMLQQCTKQEKALDQCNSDQSCAKASLDYTMCQAKQRCPLQHGSLVQVLQSGSDEKVEAALQHVTMCVTNAHAEAQRAREQLSSF